MRENKTILLYTLCLYNYGSISRIIFHMVILLSFIHALDSLFIIIQLIEEYYQL